MFWDLILSFTISFLHQFKPLEFDCASSKDTLKAAHHCPRRVNFGLLGNHQRFPLIKNGQVSVPLQLQILIKPIYKRNSDIESLSLC